MNYFIDTEFREGMIGRPFLLGGKFGDFLLGKKKPTIDLISLAIVAEDGRELYLISKDFDVKEAWKNEWLRDNVLKKVFYDLVELDHQKEEESFSSLDVSIYECDTGNFVFNKENLKHLLYVHGKSNREISKYIYHFINPEELTPNLSKSIGLKNDKNPVFHAYYADYDWVVFCWLFGRMIDLPSNFPMYCVDLKQIMDEKINFINESNYSGGPKVTSESMKKNNPNFPENPNPHHALYDARFDRDLYNFLT